MGTCTYCKRRRDVAVLHPISRYGGGNYRRAGRWYRGSICGECAQSLIPHISFRSARDSDGWELDTSLTTSRYPSYSILRIVARLVDAGEITMDAAHWRLLYQTRPSDAFGHHFPLVESRVTALIEDIRLASGSR